MNTSQVHRGFGAAIRRLSAHFSPRRKRQLTIVGALTFIGGFAEMVSIGLMIPFLSAIANPTALEGIWFIRFAMERFGVEGGDQMVAFVTIIFCVAVLLSGGLRLLLVWYFQKFVFWLGYDLALLAFEKTVNQPYRFHLSHNSSTLIAGIDKVQVAVTWVLMPIVQGATSSFMAIIILATLLFIDPVVFTAAAAGFSTVYIIITLIVRSRLTRNSKTIARAQTARVKIAQESLGGIRDVIVDHAQYQFLSLFRTIEYGYRNAQIFNSLAAQLPRFVIETAGMILLAVIAFLLSREEGGILAAIPVLGALAVGAQRLLPLCQTVYQSISQVYSNYAILHDVLDILDLKVPYNAGPADRSDRLPFAREIRLDNLCFSYAEGEPLVVDGLSLQVPKGARVAFVGKTGSGKSTATDILMGLLEASSGQILIDGEPLTPAHFTRWQNRIAHVPQSIFLADTTLAENIAFGVPRDEIDMDRLRRSAEQAKIDDFIETLPSGYETVTGERGVRLSGGQRQRIGIARALYKEADVLIFDEATSALDSDTEIAVMEAIRELGPDLTIFLIAHRLSTVRFCDMIVRLEGGKVAAIGSYDEVIANHGGEETEMKTGNLQHAL